MRKNELIPPGMSPDDFMDAIHNVTGIAPARSPGWKFKDKDVRARMARDFSQAIQAYVNRPQKTYERKIQAFIKTSDLPEPVTDLFDTFNDVQNFDMGWMQSFKDASNRIEAGRDFWEVVVLTEGSSWQLVPEGHSVKIQTRSGTLTTIKVAKYGDGIAWSDELIRFRKLGPMLDIAEDFVRGYNRDKADRFYTLLANSSSQTVAANQNADEVAADVKSINNGAFTLLNGLRNTRNLPDSQEILMYITPQFKERGLRAFGELSQTFAGSTGRVVYNVRPVFTFNSNLPAAASGESFAGLMVVPGFLNQWAQLMEPTMFDDTDILSLSFIQTAFAYYGGAVIDPNQVLTIGFK